MPKTETKNESSDNARYENVLSAALPAGLYFVRESTYSLCFSLHIRLKHIFSADFCITV